MNDRLQELPAKIKLLENEILIEIQKKEKEYFYEIRDKKAKQETGQGNTVLSA